MTEAQFVTVVKRGIAGPRDVDSQVFIDELLEDNQARWSFQEGKLYAGQAAKTLLLDPETFQAALESLAITWDPQDPQWRTFWQAKRYF